MDGGSFETGPAVRKRTYPELAGEGGQGRVLVCVGC